MSVEFICFIINVLIIILGIFWFPTGDNLVCTAHLGHKNVTGNKSSIYIYVGKKLQTELLFYETCCFANINKYWDIDLWDSCFHFTQGLHFCTISYTNYHLPKITVYKITENNNSNCKSGENKSNFFLEVVNRIIN